MPQPAACVTLLGLAIPLLYVFLGWQGLWQRAIFDSMFRKHNPDVFLTVPKAEANPVLTSPNPGNQKLTWCEAPFTIEVGSNGLATMAKNNGATDFLDAWRKSPRLHLLRIWRTMRWLK